MQNFCRICQLWLHISIRCTSWLTFPYWGGYPATFDVLHASGRVMLMKVPPILGPPSTTIHSILQVQFTCLTVIFHNLSPGPLVYLLVWNPLFHTPHISSLNHYLFFAKHAHAIATCFAEVTRLCDLYLISLSAQYLEICFFLNDTHPSHNSHLCYLKCHLTFSARCYATWYMLWACVCVCLSQVGVLQDARCRITLTVL